MPLKYTDLQGVYPTSTGFYILTKKKASLKNKHSFKIGSGRSIIKRLNDGYTLCFIPSGFWLYCVIRVKARHRTGLVKLEHNLFRFLEKHKTKRLKSTVRRGKTEWFLVKKDRLQDLVKTWCNLNKDKVIFVKGNYNAIGSWNGLKIASPLK